MNSSVEKAAKVLGIRKTWIEQNIVKSDDIVCQYQEYLLSNDKNTEHYRARIFRSYLMNKTEFTFEEIMHFVDVYYREQDEVLRAQPLFDLLQYVPICLDNLKKLCLHAAFSKSSLKKKLNRMILIQRLDTEELSDDLVVEVLESADKDVQNRALENSGLTNNHLEMLHKGGVNRGIRNKASAQKKHKKFSS